ncbi:MAG: hypothetical protein V7K25_07140 [Nostoc sp.]|uniref:hypothetical protein n=1 Tax=Nostoc sp. TaxID=1180 RepID=UPI002FF5F4CB
MPNASCSTWSEVEVVAWGDRAALAPRYRPTPTTGISPSPKATVYTQVVKFHLPLGFVL